MPNFGSGRGQMASMMHQEANSGSRTPTQSDRTPTDTVTEIASESHPIPCDVPFGAASEDISHPPGRMGDEGIASNGHAMA